MRELEKRLEGKCGTMVVGGGRAVYLGWGGGGHSGDIGGVGKGVGLTASSQLTLLGQYCLGSG